MQKLKLRKFHRSLFTPASLPARRTAGGREAGRAVHCSLHEGFSLLEVLLSIALLTIILGATYSTFFTVQRAIERFEGISLKYHEARTVLDLIRREIEGSFYKDPLTSDAKENQTFFVIEDRDIFGENISRLYLTTFSFRGGGVNSVFYEVQEKDGKLNLVKVELPPNIKITEEEEIIALFASTYALEMMEGIESFTVETLFDNKWVKTWNTQQTRNLPLVVRISIEFSDKGKKVKLTEYARPKVGGQL